MTLTYTSESGQTSNTTHLAFPSPETCATWQALLKSYAIPETYGQNLVPLEGGYYRLWRQVDLTVIQGRNLGTSNGRATRSNLNQERSEVDVSCEIHLNDIICGRTTVKNGGELIDWHESFSYPGLPPFEILEVVVWKDRKSSKPVKLGSTCIMLCNFRRGEFVEGWFPVVRRVEGLGVENHMGDLRLKVRVDECVLLPWSVVVLKFHQGSHPTVVLLCWAAGRTSSCVSFFSFLLGATRPANQEISSPGYQI